MNVIAAALNLGTATLPASAINDVDYVIIYARSRAFRNYIDAGNTKMALAKLGVKLISAKQDFADGLMAEAMEAVTDVFNWLQVRMSGEDIKVKMANKARNGGTIGRAKVGYRNVHKRIEGREVPRTPGRATCSIWQPTVSYRRRRSERS